MKERKVSRYDFKNAQKAELVNWEQYVRDSDRVQYEIDEHSEIIVPLRELAGNRTFGRGLEVGIGCFGLGFLASHFYDRISSIDGIDPLPRLEINVEDVALQDRVDRIRSRVNYTQGEGETMPFEDQSFDIVSCINVVDHAQSPQSIMREIDRVLKPGGWLVFSVSTLSLVGETLWKIRRTFKPNYWLYIAHPHTYQWSKANRLISAVSGKILYASPPSLKNAVLGRGKMSFWISAKSKK